jgi:hypothetical protein
MITSTYTNYIPNVIRIALIERYKYAGNEAMTTIQTDFAAIFDRLLVWHFLHLCLTCTCSNDLLGYVLGSFLWISIRSKIFSTKRLFYDLLHIITSCRFTSNSYQILNGLHKFTHVKCDYLWAVSVATIVSFSLDSWEKQALSVHEGSLCYWRSPMRRKSSSLESMNFVGTCNDLRGGGGGLRKEGVF